MEIVCSTQCATLVHAQNKMNPVHIFFALFGTMGREAHSLQRLVTSSTTRGQSLSPGRGKNSLFSTSYRQTLGPVGLVAET
jgi:hypothetical protein